VFAECNYLKSLGICFSFRFGWLMVFNATFNNISIKSWLLISLNQLCSKISQTFIWSNNKNMVVYFVSGNHDIELVFSVGLCAKCKYKFVIIFNQTRGLLWSWSYGRFTTTCAMHGEVCSTQHYLKMFASDLGQVGGFLQVLRFPHQYNWPPRWNIVESGVKHHKPKPKTQSNFSKGM
jgi:hypothetical protein